MQVDDEVVVPCAPEQLAPWIEDLGAYPQWMGLVHRATELEDGAWYVELRARLGPLARSKRLRMVRVVGTKPGTVRFERDEGDGRSHGRWTLAAAYRPVDGGTQLQVQLRYDGSNWTAGLLERTLRDEIERAKARLVELITDGRTPTH
jgi:hypothetical protein